MCNIVGYWGRLAGVLLAFSGMAAWAAPALAPTITTQPLAQTIVEGQKATFVVVAAGSGTLTYQWKRNNVDIMGATAASYTTPVQALSDNNSKYKVTVTDGATSVTSTEVNLAVGAATPVTITANPANKMIFVGQTATFTVAVSAASSPPFTYKWFKNNVEIAGATAVSYTTPPAVAADNLSSFRVEVKNIKNTDQSDPATLTVGPATAPSITTQPTAQSSYVGFTATFTVVAAGTSPLTYHWQKNGVDIAAGATGATYTTPALDLTDNGAKYKCHVTNAADDVFSNEANLTVSPVPFPTITTQPAGKTVVAGQTATFTVVATGVGTLMYQWKKGGVIVSTGTGGTTASYTTAVTTTANSGEVYTVTVSNTAGPVTSSDATLTVTPLTPPTITVQPANRTVVVGFPATFSVTATSTATVTYKWFKNGVAIASATNSTYTTPVTTLANDGDIYTVVASNTAGGTTSAPATLSVETSASSIPDYYLDQDIGAVGMPGDASLDGTVFTVCGAGANIGGTADAFHFLYQPLTGNGTSFARLTPGTTGAQAKVGVMIRETLAADSKMAGVFVTGTHGTVMINRLTAGGTAAAVAGTPAVVPVPTWVRLERTGDTFIGSTSPDGSNWTVVATVTIPMPSGVYIGYAVTSGDVGELHCATVDSFGGSGGWRAALRKASSGGGGGGGCGLMGLEGLVLALLLRRCRR